MVVQGNVTLVEIEHPPELSTSERILSAVDFPTDSLVYATWMNRVQNRAYFQLCDVDNLLPNCTTVGISSFSRERQSSSSEQNEKGKEERGRGGTRLIIPFTEIPLSLFLCILHSLFFKFPRILI